VTPSGGGCFEGGLGAMGLPQKVEDQTDSCSCEKRQESDICLLLTN